MLWHRTLRPKSDKHVAHEYHFQQKLVHRDKELHCTNNLCVLYIQSIFTYCICNTTTNRDFSMSFMDQIITVVHRYMVKTGCAYCSVRYWWCREMWWPITCFPYYSSQHVWPKCQSIQFNIVTYYYTAGIFPWFFNNKPAFHNPSII